jgi:hypothetical protein
MKKFLAMVGGTIADEDTCFGAKIEFMLVVRPKVRPTSTSKKHA